MGLFGKKEGSRDAIIAAAVASTEAPAQEEKKDDFSSGNPKLDIEFAKIKGRMDGFDEVRKASSERFTRISEQVGELRGMIMDTNKTMSKIEVSSTKAIDLVESVHPEKLMVEVRKQDGKIEGLRANIESNEAITKDVMLELKKMRDKMNFYKGIEQVIALNEEIKQELSTIKRVEANIERHADKVETVFIEVQKKFSDFDKFNDVVKDLDKSFKKLAGDFEKVRVKVETKLDHKEFVDLLDKFNDFEKHTTNLLKLLDERNKTIKQELDSEFSKLEIEYRKKMGKIPPPSATPTEGPPPVAPSSPSGEDGAGSDVKPGLGAKIKGFFFKSEAAPK